MFSIKFNPITREQEILDRNKKRQIEITSFCFKTTLHEYMETLKELGEI